MLIYLVFKCFGIKALGSPAVPLAIIPLDSDLSAQQKVGLHWQLRLYAARTSFTHPLHMHSGADLHSLKAVCGAGVVSQQACWVSLPLGVLLCITCTSTGRLDGASWCCCSAGCALFACVLCCCAVAACIRLNELKFHARGMRLPGYYESIL